MSLPKHDDILTYDAWIKYVKQAYPENKLLRDDDNTGNKALATGLKNFHSDYKKNVTPAVMLQTTKALQKAIETYKKAFGIGVIKTFHALIENPTSRYEKVLEKLVN